MKNMYDGLLSLKFQMDVLLSLSLNERSISRYVRFSYKVLQVVSAASANAVYEAHLLLIFKHNVLFLLSYYS